MAPNSSGVAPTVTDKFLIFYDHRMSVMQSVILHRAARLKRAMRQMRASMALVTAMQAD